MESYKQWKVVAEGYKETFDNLPEAKRAYGKKRNMIKSGDEEGRCRLFFRDNPKDAWNLLQEYHEGEDANEED